MLASDVNELYYQDVKLTPDVNIFLLLSSSDVSIHA